MKTSLYLPISMINMVLKKNILKYQMLEDKT